MASRSRALAPAPQVTPASPVVKWVGGKTRLLHQLLARIPEHFGRYYEPFCGGAALFFRLAPRHAVLARAQLRCDHYLDAVADAKAGDFAYFDPPYDPVTTTANFTSYTAEAFGPDDQRALADCARGLVARGCRVMLSNSDTPYIR